MFRVLHGLDQPYNLAPSLHIAMAIILWDLYRTKLRGWWRAIGAVWFMLIGISTLLTWQHHLVDVVAGGALGLGCLLIVPARAGSSRSEKAQVLRTRDGSCAAVGQIGWVDGHPALIAGAIECSQQVRPLRVTAANRRGFRAFVVANHRVAGANVANKMPERREDFIAIPVVAEDGDRIQVDSKPWTSRRIQHLVKRRKARQRSRKRKRHAVSVGTAAKIHQGLVDLRCK
jgi:hypothetical protein